MANKLNTLELSRQETETLLSIERLLIKNDIDKTDELALKEKKQKWLDTWESDINKFLGKYGLGLMSDIYSIIDALRLNLSITSIAILLESLLFMPFFRLSDKNKAGFGKKITRQEYISSSEEIIYKLADHAKVQTQDVREWRHEYEESIKIISKRRAFPRIKSPLIVAAGMSSTTSIEWWSFPTMVGSSARMMSSEANRIGIILLGSNIITLSASETREDTLSTICGRFIIADNGLTLGLEQIFFNANFVITQLAKMHTLMKIVPMNPDDRIEIQNLLRDGYIKALRKLNKLCKWYESFQQQSKKEIKELRKSIEYISTAYLIAEPIKFNIIQ